MASEQWAFTADGIIWKLLYAPSQKIIGEVRNTDERRATFFCLDASTGVPLWQNIQKDEPWWIEVVSADNDAVYFSRFVQPDIPQHRGIECCSMVDCSTLWKNDSVAFWFEQDGRLCAYSDLYEQRCMYWVSKKTGEVLEEIHDVHQIAQTLKTDEQVVVPIPLDMSEIENEVLEYLRKQSKEPVLERNIEIIPLDKVVIVGYYTQNRGNTLTLHLDVCDRVTQQSVYSVVQCRECNFPVGENFFVVDSMLYYVKDQRTLIGVNVWKS